MCRTVLSVLMILTVHGLYAQIAQYVVSRYSDDLREWDLLDEFEETVGSLTVAWPLDGRWDEWRYETADASGDIRMKWQDDPNLWELTGYNGIITMRTTFKNDFSEWRITTDQSSYTWRTKYRSQPANLWELRNSREGVFQMEASYRGDPRDWLISDEMDESVPEDLKLACLFLAIYHSLP